MLKTITPTIILVSAAALLVACGGDPSNEAKEKQLEDTAKKYGVNADVELDKDGDVKTVAIDNGLGGQYGQGLDLPAGFPADVAMPAGANILAATKVPGQKDGFSVQALATDDADTIVSTLTTGMESEGWTKIASDQPTPQMQRIGFEKDDRMANFVITANGETNMVQVVTMAKP